MTTRRTLTRLQEQLLADGADCANCPLGRGGAPSRPVPTSWDIRRGSPRLALVGEAPGVQEVRRSAVFIGPSGRLLDTACRAGGVPRAEFAILNSAACGPIPSGADDIKDRALAACRPRLINELRRLRPKVILSIGGLALRTLAPQVTSGVTALRGALLDVGADVPTANWTPMFLGSLHPAHILRGGDGDAPDAPGGEGGRSVDLLYYFLVYDLAKAWRLATDRAKPWVDDCDLFLVHNGRLRRAAVDEMGKPVVGDLATPEELIEAIDRVAREAAERDVFFCDVETDAKDSLEANLTAIGFATTAGGMSATWDAWRMVPEALANARALLAGPIAKGFWNRIYDCIVLPRHELPVANPIVDGMLAHHAAFPGLPHKLDQVAQQFLVAPPWKAEFRRSSRNDAELILYNFRDSLCTALIYEPILHVVEQHKTGRAYEADRQVVAIAQRMRQFGFWIDRKEQARQSKVQHARLEYMRTSLERDFAAIQPAWRDRLARNLAVIQRKKDPDAFMDRVQLRYAEIAERETRPTDVGLLKTKAKQDLVALFEVLRIPFSSYTKRGSPVTDKKAMEAAAAKHPLMRQLIHMREAQHVLATYIDGLPVKRDGRVHPDWSVTKISGRWSAGKSQNVPKQVSGWPPEEEVDPGYLPALDDVDSSEVGRGARLGYRFKRKPSGDYVTPTENARAIVTAPTVEEILLHSLECPDVYEDARYRRILDRAFEGHGRLIVGADQVQLELKIAALLGQIKFLLDAYEKKADVHALNAAVCFPKVFPGLEATFKVIHAEQNLAERFGKVTLKTDFSKLALDDATRAQLVKTQKVWSKLRDLAKRLAYAWEYRGMAETAYASLVREFPEVELAAVKESFRLLDQQMPEWMAWCNRNEIYVRQNREIREALLGRVRLTPLGNFDLNIATNFPIQAFGASLIDFALLRFAALVTPELLELEKLYAMDLLDRAWVEARRHEGYDQWAGPAELLIHAHDAYYVECDEEDGSVACPKCARVGFGAKCSCGASLPLSRMARFIELCMDFQITINGATMHFYGEADTGRRLSEA